MLDQGRDQAAGLRQQPGGALNLLALAVTAGSGSQWVVQVARALSAAGTRPVVVDASRGEVARAFGLQPRHDLLDLLQGAHAFDTVARRTPEGAWLLRADRGVEAFVGSGAPSQQLFAGFARLSQGFGALVLAMPAHELACLASPALATPVLVLEPGEQGLRQAYGTLKQLAQGFGYRRFAVLADGPAAGHTRLADVAGRFLQAEVALAGRLAPGAGAGAPELAHDLLHAAATPLALH